MKEFDYSIDYKNEFFRPNDTRYRIGRGEQGVLLVRPYTDVICRHWRFKTLKEARVSSQKIFDMYLDYRILKDFVGMDMCRKFLEMGFTRARRYANHKDGKVLPQEKDWATSEKAKAAKRFKEFRDLVTQDEFYISMRKEWRDKENVRRV